MYLCVCSPFSYETSTEASLAPGIDLRTVQTAWPQPQQWGLFGAKNSREGPRLLFHVSCLLKDYEQSF